MRAWSWLFVIVPFVEAYLLIALTRATSFGTTGVMILGTGLVGAVVAKHEGLRVWRQSQEAIRQGRLPETGILSSLLVLAGAILLMAPGVLTDVVGLLLLVPPMRGWVIRLLRRSPQAHWPRERAVPGHRSGWARMDARHAQRESDAELKRP